MLDFQKLNIQQAELYRSYLRHAAHRGCAYGFANLYLWGRQFGTFLGDHLVLFSHFAGHTLYPFPIGAGDPKPALDAIIADAHERGIPCRITGLTDQEKAFLEQTYPGQFRYHCDRDSFDYVYDINDLAELRGKKFQPKRNHVNRFLADYPDAYVRPLDELTLPDCMAFTKKWYERRHADDPMADLQMERMALDRAYRYDRELRMEGLLLYADGRVIAMTMGSFLGENTMDVHCEKGDADIPGSYAAINRAFARYLREKHPELRWLNREDDVGSPGLRKAKLSYQPHHLVEKCWAHYAGEEFND